MAKSGAKTFTPPAAGSMSIFLHLIERETHSKKSLNGRFFQPKESTHSISSFPKWFVSSPVKILVLTIWPFIFSSEPKCPQIPSCFIIYNPFRKIYFSIQSDLNFKVQILSFFSHFLRFIKTFFLNHFLFGSIFAITLTFCFTTRFMNAFSINEKSRSSANFI